MLKDSPRKLKNAVQKAENIVVVTHYSPDGDAMGSSLALKMILEDFGKKVSVVVPNPFPDFLKWLPGSARVVDFSATPRKVKRLLAGADLIFALDFNAYKRLEELGDLLAAAPAPKVLIDHHQEPERFARYYFQDETACSTCELIYEFAQAIGAGGHINARVAACIYTGIMTDTGSFRYPSVKARTHRIIASLLETGIVPSDIHSAVYDNYSLERLKLLGFALNEKLRLVEGYPVAYLTLSRQELKRFNFKKGDTEGLVNYPFAIKGIKLCALFNESEGKIKASFRSKGRVDVNKYARRYFNGGGHINAAGGRSDQTLEETERKFVETVKTLFK